MSNLIQSLIANVFEYKEIVNRMVFRVKVPVNGEKMIFFSTFQNKRPTNIPAMQTMKKILIPGNSARMLAKLSTNKIGSVYQIILVRYTKRNDWHAAWKNYIRSLVTYLR